ncbi:uncharacterized protein DEA37_0013930 [Paragonimus westermani]|uniref:Uncharacterized protein n=1 Tax=Paragonimus westermani TaxID=34504 RepID=A0A5J4NCK0_9TREM|nr:uncharacterized protein DEA37_0013930 [Paragonimus westermani]
MARRIALRNSMSTAAINVMLTELRHLYPHLSKDARTLLGTPRASKSRTICEGHYVYFGLKNVFDKVLRNYEQCDAVKLQVHVDGVSLFKSSRAQPWTILGRLTSPKNSRVHCGGIQWLDGAWEHVRIFRGSYQLNVGEEEMVYSIHCLTHIPEDVRRRGPLDGFSAFPFESHISRLRLMVRCLTLPASQLFRRSVERHDCDILEAHPTTDDVLYHCPPSPCNQNAGVALKGPFYSDKPPNNCAIVNGSPTVIELVHGERILLKRYAQVEAFFKKCIPSVDLNIFKCYSPSSTPFKIHCGHPAQVSTFTVEGPLNCLPYLAHNKPLT